MSLSLTLTDTVNRATAPTSAGAIEAMGTPYLSHPERVEADRDHVEFFTMLGADQLDVDVPTCPDRTVEGVLRHVSGGARTVCEMVERAGDPGFDIETPTR